ncbi:rhodanese-like domain-containing protein [Mycetocola reblochoni]|uniref:Rhodanese-like domain-containing protein n=1 Tax=Mycetocola reblochoni TaxID=331618 RepID=A0A3L6ZKT4_9MICO|nr:rhodanese-like domain-containing protein [Mycetocola reblochoni]
MDVTELAALGDGAVIVDVREPDELQRVRLASAVSIPLSRFLESVGELPDAEPLYVLCHSGGRSARVAAYLEQSGREAVNVRGGITAWAEAGLPVVRDETPDA